VAGASSAESPRSPEEGRQRRPQMRDGRTPCSNSYPLFEGFDATTGPGQEFVAPSRGPLLAQTSRNPPWQPCGIVALRPPQNRMDKGVSRGASSRVVVPLPTRRAGGRWFEPSTAHLTKAPAHAGFFFEARPSATSLPTGRSGNVSRDGAVVSASAHPASFFAPRRVSVNRSSR
jgi:hypothetical protein